MHPNPMADTSRLLFPSFLFCMAFPLVVMDVELAGDFGDALARVGSRSIAHCSAPIRPISTIERKVGSRFPDPAVPLPNPVRMANFVHAEATSAVRWIRRIRGQSGETDRGTQ